MEYDFRNNNSGIFGRTFWDFYLESDDKNKSVVAYVIIYRSTIIEMIRVITLAHTAILIPSNFQLIVTVIAFL